MHDAALEQVTLADHDGDCEALSAIPAGVVPNLDVSWIEIHAVGSAFIECLVEFSFELSSVHEEDVVCEVSATFRLVYRCAPLRTEPDRREFAATRAVIDAWPYWRSHLIHTMAMMGLQPAHLAPQPPPELTPSAREAFDFALRKIAEREEA